MDLYNNELDYLYKIAPKINIKYSDYSFVPHLFRPNKDQFTRITRIGYVLLHGLNVMGRYVTTTYRPHKLPVYVVSGYVATTYP